MISVAPARRRTAAAAAALLCGVGLVAACSSGSSPRTSPSTAPTTAPSTSGPGTTTSNQPGSTSAPAYAAELRTQIEQAMKADGTPGAVVLIRSKKGNWSSAFGVRKLGDPAPMQVGDTFRLADITETITASEILKLQEQGKLALTDPVSKYVPGVPNGDRITLTDLGSYRSGLYDYQQDPAFIAEYGRTPTRSYTPQDLLKFAFAHPADPVGTEGYSATDFVLLGLVAEKVTGQPLAKAFDSDLFTPAKLNGIGLADGTTLPAPHADGYSFSNPFADSTLPADQRQAVADGKRKPADRTADNASWGFATATAYGTASSTADLVDSMLGGSMLSEESKTARLPSDTDTDTDTAQAADPGDVRYGFGMAAYGQYLFYSGTMPGYGALAAYDPAGTTIVVLTNLAYAPDGGSPVTKIFMAALAAVDPAQLPAS